MRTFACLLLLLGLAALPAVEGAPAPAPAPTPAPAPAVTPASPPLFTDQEWTNGQRNAPPAGTAPGVGSAATMLVGLALVVGLALGLGWLLKRLNARRLLGGRGRHLEVLETVSIGPRRQLALVRCGGHWLVVGMGEREMVAVATLPAPPEPAPVAATTPDAVPVPASASPATSSPFAAELARLLGGRKP